MPEKVDGKPDFEFPHIIAKNGKIYCNNCGEWDWLKHWMTFIDDHENCKPDEDKL